MVGVAGLEPAASWSRTKRDTKLRHTPATFVIIPTYLMFVKCYFQRAWCWNFDEIMNVYIDNLNQV